MLPIPCNAGQIPFSNEYFSVLYLIIKYYFTFYFILFCIFKFFYRKQRQLKTIKFIFSVFHKKIERKSTTYYWPHRYEEGA